MFAIKTLFNEQFCRKSPLWFMVLFVLIVHECGWGPKALAIDDIQDISSENQSTNQELLRARQLLIEGTDCLHNNQSQQAKSKLMDACTVAPQLPQAHHQLGIALAKLGENEDAANEFSTAIKLDPSLAASWMNLAAVYQSSGKIQEAKTTYQEFIKRFPQDRDVAKIRSLIAVLDKETTSEASTEQAGDSNTGNAHDDYYAAVIQHGIWLWRKDHLPLAVYIESPSAKNGASPQYISILKNAFRDWIAASEGMISLDFLKDASEASIVCTWSKDISKFKNSNEAANTRIYGDKSGLNRAELEILTISADKGNPINENQARATCLHEVGHVLGLAGHSTNPDDVMYISATLKDAWLVISNRDKNTLIHLYSSNK